MLSDREQQAFDELTKGLNTLGSEMSTRRRRRKWLSVVLSVGGFALTLATFTSLLVVAIAGLAACYVGLWLGLRLFQERTPKPRGDFGEHMFDHLHRFLD